MRGHSKHFSVAIVLMIAVAVLPSLEIAAAQPPPPPPTPLTPWCASQKAACETTCKEVPQTASVDFKCLDQGISSTTSTRSLQCVCLDAGGNILSSSTLGGAGAATISAGGSSSSSASSASGTASSGR
jgi:hypothetical protein